MVREAVRLAGIGIVAAALIVVLVAPWGWAQRDVRVDGDLETTRWTLFSWGHAEDGSMRPFQSPEGAMPLRNAVGFGLYLGAAASAAALWWGPSWPRWVRHAAATAVPVMVLAAWESHSLLAGVVDVCGPGRMTADAQGVTQYRCPTAVHISKGAVAWMLVAGTTGLWPTARPSAPADGPLPALPESEADGDRHEP